MNLRRNYINKTYQHMKVMQKLNTQRTDFQYKLGIVSVCVPVFPETFMMHVPQMNDVSNTT